MLGSLRLMLDNCLHHLRRIAPLDPVFNHVHLIAVLASHIIGTYLGESDVKLSYPSILTLSTIFSESEEIVPVLECSCGSHGPQVHHQ